MKRIIFISILSAFVFSLLFAFSIQALRAAQWQLEFLYGENIKEYGEAYIASFRSSAYASLRNGLLYLLGCLCMIAIYALIAVKEFKIFQQYVDKYNEKCTARKQERLSRKTAKSEADKQKRIAELQAELDELQDKTNSGS